MLYRKAGSRTLLIPTAPQFKQRLEAVVISVCNHIRYRQQFYCPSVQVEAILGKSRYLAGDTITEADVRLFTTLVRFDMVYVGHFKVQSVVVNHLGIYVEGRVMKS